MFRNTIQKTPELTSLLQHATNYWSGYKGVVITPRSYAERPAEPGWSLSYTNIVWNGIA